MYFHVDVTILTRPRSDAVESTRDIALQLKPVLSTDRLIQLEEIRGYGRHENLQ
jgi:hypothetical protein